MKDVPIPPYTVANLCGAIGDVIRAAGAWGESAAKGEAPDQSVALVMQCAAQLLTLALQREPTDAELLAVIGG